MIITNIYEAKAKLSEFLDAAARGERVVICKRNQPVAELHAVAPARTAPRDLEPLYPGVEISPGFYEPLSEEDLDAFEGVVAGQRATPRVAEGRQTYPAATARRKPRK